MMMLMSYLNETVAGDAGSTAERNTCEPCIDVKSWREQIPGSFPEFRFVFLFFLAEAEKLLLLVTF